MVRHSKMDIIKIRLENIANSIDDKMVYDKLDFEYKVKFISSLSKKFRLAKFNKKEFKL